MCLFIAQTLLGGSLGGSAALEYHSAATKTAKGRRTGALSGDCSQDSFKAATTSRDPFFHSAGRTWDPRPLHRAAKTLKRGAEALETESPRGALCSQTAGSWHSESAPGPPRRARPSRRTLGSRARSPPPSAAPAPPPIPDPSSVAAAPGNKPAEQRRRKTLGLPL